MRLKIAEKQENCCRLYFLSDAAVLELLSAVAESGKIEIWRLFPGVEELHLEERKVTGLVRYGAPYRLPKPVKLGQHSSTRGVEDWTAELDHVLKEHHRGQINSLLANYRSNGLQWDSYKDHEVSLIAYFAWMTQALQKAVEGTEPKAGLQQLQEALKVMLEEGIKTFQPQGESPLDRFSRDEFVLAEDQHQKRPNENLAHLVLAHIEFLQTLLESQDCDFSLLWKTAIKLREVPGEQFTLVTDCFDLTSQFSFETHSCDFLQSLVLTPLTERHSWHVYLTLKRGQGCLLLGTSDCDKTETIKLLAVACGKMYQSLSVTANTQFEVVVKYVVGCVSGGFWGCFEEVHALEAIHLSTLAKYVKNAMTSTVSPAARVGIDAYQIKPKPGFALFGTSRPAAYPSSVTSAFRAIAVAKPDLSISACILLQTLGIPQARKYGRMISEAMQILAEPVLVLSSGGTLNLHMKATTRTLLRLIRAMSSMEKEHYGQDLDYLLNNAFRQVYGLGQPVKELSALDECLATLFHAAHSEKLSRISAKGPSVDVITKLVACEEVLKPEVLVKRCQQLFSLITVADWPWVFVAGQANSGKSAAISLAAKAVAVASGTGFQVHKLGPVVSNATLGELFQQLQTAKSTWSAFPQHTNAVPVGTNAAPFSPRDWIHVDSATLPYTSDLLFSLTKASPYSTVKILIETESLAGLDPGLVAEGGLLYVEKDEIDLFDYYLTIMARTCEKAKTILLPTMERLYNVLFQPTCVYFKTAEKTMKVDAKLLIQLFSRLLKPFLRLIRKKEKIEESQRNLLQTSNELASSRRAMTFAPLVAKLLIEESRKDTILARDTNSRQSSVLRDLTSMRRHRKIKPRMILEAVYLVSLVTVVSNFLQEPDVYCKLVLDWVKTQGEEFAGFVLREYDSLKATSLLEMTFSIKQMNWTLLLSMFTAKPQGIGKMSERSPRPDSPLGRFETSAFTAKYRDELIVPTASTQRLSYWVEFCLRNQIDIAVFGPHQSGKSAITVAVAKELLGGGFFGLISLNISSHLQNSAVQGLIESSMESRRQREYGGVGGSHYFAVVDDMNLDASNELYDLWRFWKETGGWYSRGFTRISDLTVALVHSYVEGQSRPIQLRALRHFVVLHKPAYSQSELGSIFRQFIYYSTPEEGDQDGMLSVAEESMRSLVALYSELCSVNTEQMWAQMAIGNFAQGLRFVAQFEVNEEMDIPQYLRIWTFMFTRFFFDQFGSTETPLKQVIAANLQTLIDRFTDSDAEAVSIVRSAVLIPSTQQAENSSPRPFSGFEYIRDDTVPVLVHLFRESRAAAAVKHPVKFKHLHSLLFDIEERVSAYLSFYLSVLYDLNGTCQSLVVHTSGPPGLVKALAYMAAETLQIRVFEFNSEENADAFSEALIDTFKGFSQNYFPTTPRFEVKRLMEETMLNNHKAAVIITLQGEGQLTHSLTQRYMEIALNIVTGVKLSLTGFASCYTEFVDRYREGASGVALYNDEILQLLLSRMKANTTFLFIMAAGEDSWLRSPLHNVGILEQFKHEYRTIFNRSRIVAFDQLQANPRLVELVKEQEDLLKEWRLDFSPDLLKEAGECLQSLDLGIVCDEHTYECVAYCSKTLVAEGSTRRIGKKASLRKAVEQIDAIQAEVGRAEEFSAALRLELEGIEKTLQACQSQLAESEIYLSQALSHPYEQECRARLEERRKEQQWLLAQAREVWEAAIETCGQGLEDLTEMEKVVTHPAAVRVVYLFCALVNQTKGEAGPGEKVEALMKKWLVQAAKKWKEVARKLRSLPGESMPDFSDLFASYEAASSTTRSVHLFRCISDLISASIAFKSSYQVWSGANQSLDQEEASIPAQVATIRGKLADEEQEVQSSLHYHITDQETKARALRQKLNFLRDRKSDLIDLVQSLAVVKEAWEDALETYQEDDQYAQYESILAGFYIITGLKYGASQRKAVWKCVSKVMDQRGFGCQDVESVTPRLLTDFTRFALDCVKFELADSVFFYESAAYLRLVLELNLPFPLIYDPFDVAFQYISRMEESKGVLVGRVSSDSEFESKLRECVATGRPVVCQNPSQSLYKAVYPAILWRSQCFLLSLRGLSTESCTMKLQQKNITVHPNFRLYLCYSHDPPYLLRQQMTAISFEVEDRESWEGLLVTPLLKVLDGQQFREYTTQEVQSAQVRVSIRNEENDFLEEILKCDPSKVLFSEEIEKILSVKCTKLHFGGKGVTRRASTFYQANDSSLISEGEPLAGPKDKLQPMLSQLYSLKSVLSTLYPALEEYAVSGKALFGVIIRALREHVRTIAVPPQTQWEALTESLVYNVFVRIYHSMAKDKRAILSSFYALFRSYGAETVQKEEFYQVLEDLILVSTVDQSSALSHLRSRYPVLFPSHFSPGTASFKVFLERDTYQDAKLPDTLPCLYKFLLYAYLRPDLLPAYSQRILKDALGPRYAWLPDFDLNLLTVDTAKVPCLLFYECTSPLLYLRHIAEAKKVQLIVVQPLYPSVAKYTKAEMRGIGRYSDPVFAEVAARAGSNCWVVVENLNLIDGLEGEVLTKFLLTKAAENSHEGFRIFLLFQGSPKAYPDWSKLISDSMRGVIPEPQSVKDQLSLWYQDGDFAFHERQQDYLQRSFWSNCTLTLTSEAKSEVKLKSAFQSALQETESSAVQDTPSINPRTAFSVSLLCSILTVRNRYHQGMTGLWPLLEARQVVEDFLSCLPVDANSIQLLRASTLALCCSLLVPGIQHFSASGFMSLAQQVLGEEKAALMLRSRELVARLNTLEYPLYVTEKPDKGLNLHLILARYPTEDHLFLTGLSHRLASEECRLIAQAILPAIASLPLAIADKGFPVSAAKHTGTKARVADTLQALLTELIEALPEPSVLHGPQFSATRNYIYKKRASWLSKAPARPKDPLTTDLRNSILDQPPQLSDTWTVVRTAEEQMKAAFLQTVKKPLVEMLRFLTYARSTLSSEDWKLLEVVANGKVPSRWLEISPFVAKDRTDFAAWKASIIASFSKSIEEDIISLSALFSPLLALQTILRAFSLHLFRQRENARAMPTSEFSGEYSPDVSPRRTPKNLKFYHLGFALSTQEGLGQFEIAVAGLAVHGARVSESGLLEDWEGDWPLPTVYFSPVEIPKEIRNNSAYPPGLKLLLKGAQEVGADWEAGRQAASLLFQRPAYPESSHQPAVPPAYVYCPLEVGCAAWVLLGSREPQGYWSKRGVRIVLKP